jgi:hypothetical protein
MVNSTAGETGFDAGAEGATAPETLRQKDRVALERFQKKWTPLFRFGSATGTKTRDVQRFKETLKRLWHSGKQAQASPKEQPG